MTEAERQAYLASALSFVSKLPGQQIQTAMPLLGARPSVTTQGKARLPEVAAERGALWAQTLFSGSSGNATVVGYGEQLLLVDAGKSAAKIEAGLQAIGKSPEQLLGVLLTHEHSDHVSGLDVFCRRWHLPIFATEGTLRAVYARFRQPAAMELIATCYSQLLEIGPFSVQCIATSHDAAQPTGYRFTASKILEQGANPKPSLAVLTDLGYVDPSQIRALEGVDLLILEANYDEDMLRHGPYTPRQKQRIRGHQGHLSNPDCIQLMQQLLAQGTKQFILAHVSEVNNQVDLLECQVIRELEKEGWHCPEDYVFAVAGRHTPSERWWTRHAD